MAIFITQARFTKDGLQELFAAPEDRVGAIDRLIVKVGGSCIATYLTSGDYDILLIFEAPSYEDAVPALIAAAAGSGVIDLKTVTALTSSEMKGALVKAGSIAANDRPAGVTAAGLSLSEPKTDPSNPDPERTETADETQEDAKAATVVLDAHRKAVDDMKAGRPAPYYFAPPATSVPSRAAPSAPSTNNADAAKK